MFDAIFANLATGFASACGGPFFAAVARWQGTPVTDDGGSIITPATPVDKTCIVQIDAATQAMRAAEGFVETDVRIIVLAGLLDGVLDEAAVIVVADGQYAGTWALLSVVRDPAGIGYECRARRA